MCRQLAVKSDIGVVDSPLQASRVRHDCQAHRACLQAASGPTTQHDGDPSHADDEERRRRPDADLLLEVAEQPAALPLGQQRELAPQLDGELHSARRLHPGRRRERHLQIRRLVRAADESDDAPCAPDVQRVLVLAPAELSSLAGTTR